jgi:dolichol-phosphate mannosyltransferase
LNLSEEFAFYSRLFVRSLRGAVSTEQVELSVVVPCHNEEDAIADCHADLVRVLDGAVSSFEIIYVNDGSSDATSAALRDLRARDTRARFIEFSRNFGQPAAIAAGLEFARGRAVAVIDADLQDPPELLPSMLALWREGYDVVYGRRTSRDGESWFKRASATAFYRVFERIAQINAPVDVGDFRIMDRRVVDELCRLGEQHRYMRGLVSWTGFRQIGVPYQRRPRLAGETKYSGAKMFRIASDALFSFSLVPLRLAMWIGVTAAAIALIGIAYAVALRLLTSLWVSGWTLLFVAVAFLGGIQLIMLGVLGEYVGRIFMEVKRRPLFIISDAEGFGMEMEPRIARRQSHEPSLTPIPTGGSRKVQP